MCYEVFVVKSVPFVWAPVKYAWQFSAVGLSPAQQRITLIGQTGSVAPWINLICHRYSILSSTLRKYHSHVLAVTDCLEVSTPPLAGQAEEEAAMVRRYKARQSRMVFSG